MPEIDKITQKMVSQSSKGFSQSVAGSCAHHSTSDSTLIPFWEDHTFSYNLLMKYELTPFQYARKKSLVQLRKEVNHEKADEESASETLV